MRRMISLVVAGFLVAMMLTAAPSQAANEMGTTRAGNYFNKHSCRGKAAASKWFKVVFHGESSIPMSEVRRRLPELKRETRKLGRAYDTFGQKILNPPAAWPTNVALLVRRYAKLIVRLGGVLTEAGNATSAREFARLVNESFRISFGQKYGKIRAVLDLPKQTRC